MSEAGDSLQELLDGVERFTVDEIAKMKQHCAKLENNFSKKIQEMEQQINSLKTNVDNHTNLVDTSVQDITSKISRVEVHEKILDTSVNDVKVRMQTIDQIIDDLTETMRRAEVRNKERLRSTLKMALDSLDDNEDPPYSSTPIASSSGSRHHVTPSTFYGSQTANEDNEVQLTDESFDLLQPFAGPTSKTDKLSKYQRAFFKYFLSCNPKEKLSDLLAHRCIEEGVTMGVWKREWVPEGVSEFTSYIKERMRNDKKYQNRLSLRQSQQKRLSSFLDSSMKTKIVEDEDNVVMDHDGENVDRLC